MKINYDEENKIESIVLSPGEAFVVKVEGKEDEIIVISNEHHKKGFITLQGKKQLLNQDSPVFLPDSSFKEIDINLLE